MKKYTVYFSFEGNLSIDVDAKNEDSAKDLAWEILENMDRREIGSNVEEFQCNGAEESKE